VTAGRLARRAGLPGAGVWALRLFAWGVLAAMVAPLAVVVGASFAGESYIEFPPARPGLAWYRAFFADPIFVKSLALSAQLAASAAVVATVVGFLAAYVLVRARFPGRRLAWGLVLSPLIVPQIVLGVALLHFFTLLGLATTYFGLLAAHVVSVLPFVVRTVAAALLGINPQVEDAAADLGANRIETLVLVVAPMVKGGLLAGGLFAFIMSWINVEVSIFLGVTGTYTLPVVLYNFVEYSLTSVVMAAAAIAIYVAIVLVVVVDRFFGLHTAARL
jgi:putative spermidine/putrescine transport system permease protein